MLKQTLLDEKSNFKINSRSVAQLSNCLNPLCCLCYFYNFFHGGQQKVSELSIAAVDKLSLKEPWSLLLFFLAMEIKIMPLLRPTLMKIYAFWSDSM